MVAPPRVLEINVVSAHDLALLSKTMKTYAVAWVDPERKLTTKVDQTGLDNPVWGDKFVFRVDDRFLRDETSAIMIEIYAAAWVKDALIGTVKVLTSHLFGSLLNATSTTRCVALQVRRPSGRPQGILNLGVTLLDNHMRSMPLLMDLCSIGGGLSDVTEDYTRNNANPQQRGHDDDQDRAATTKTKTTTNKKLLRSQSDKTDLTSEDYFKHNCHKQDDDDPKTHDDSVVGDFKGCGGSMVNESLCYSDVGPSASVVAAAIAKGLYRVPVPANGAGGSGGGSITEEWKAKASNEEELKTKLDRWKTELPPIYDHSKLKANSKHGGRPRRKSDNGLFSCFGNAFGCEISITCGGSKKKNNHNNGKVCNLSSVDGSSITQSYI